MAGTPQLRVVEAARVPELRRFPDKTCWDGNHRVRARVSRAGGNHDGTPSRDRAGDTVRKLLGPLDHQLQGRGARPSPDNAQIAEGSPVLVGKAGIEGEKRKAVSGVRQIVRLDDAVAV